MIFENIWARTEKAMMLSLYDRMAYLTRDDYAMFDDNLGFFQGYFQELTK